MMAQNETHETREDQVPGVYDTFTEDAVRQIVAGMAQRPEISDIALSWHRAYALVEYTVTKDGQRVAIRTPFPLTLPPAPGGRSI